MNAMSNYFEFTTYRDPNNPDREVKVTAIPHTLADRDINLIGCLTSDELYNGATWPRAAKSGYVEPLWNGDPFKTERFIVATFKEMAEMRAYRLSGYAMEMRGVECQVNHAMVLKIAKMLNNDVEAVVNTLVQTMV